MGLFGDLAMLAVNFFCKSATTEKERADYKRNSNQFYQAEVKGLKEAYDKLFPNASCYPDLVEVTRSFGTQYGMCMSIYGRTASVLVCGKGGEYYVRREDVLNVKSL